MKTVNILHQCNCLTVRAHGLSEPIEKKYPEAAIYSKRRPMGRRNLAIPEDRSSPGTFIISDSVISLFGQWRPGKIGSPYFSSYPESNPIETTEQRLLWFREGLKKIGMHFSTLNQKITIAVPHGIGCGLAGGCWKDYLESLTDFQEEYREWITITLYQLK